MGTLEHLNMTYFASENLPRKTRHTVKFKVKNLMQLVKHASSKTTLKSWDKYKTNINEKGNISLVCVVDEHLQKPQTFQYNHNLNVFDVNFLRKEKIYAKLKYSRSPQYDIVSGGLAAILSGFIGFLICEKFGLELLDSGDFYIAFMYGVFIVFTLRPLLRSVSGFKKDGTYSPNYSVLSPQSILYFYRNLITLLFKIKK